MENASKALIIAGAILLSILIIGIGMFIYQQAANAIGNTGLDEQEAATYNAKFTSYEGTVTGAKAISLCNDVSAHNRTNSEDESRQILVVENEDVSTQTNAAETEGEDKLASAAAVKANLRSGYTYKVTLAYDKSSGLIYKIGISKVTGTK